MQYWQRLHEYLKEIDGTLERPIELTIIGGAALILEYHLENRIEYAKGTFKNLRIFILDLYDLVLSKLDRCSSKDRDDIQWLKENFVIDVDRLIKAYQEGRLNALNPGRVDGNFLYILDAVFGKEMTKEELLKR